MDDFEIMLAAVRVSVERFVRFRLNAKADADDVLQEVYLTAYQRFNQLKKKDSFKAWILSIARNKCNDYFRKRAIQFEIPIDGLAEQGFSDGRHGVSEVYTVRDTWELLGDKDKQILYLYFWKEMSQAEIAKRLDIPVGTVKSRLHTAKQEFKSKYPYRTGRSKGENAREQSSFTSGFYKNGGISMKKLPEWLPEYKIEESSESPFAVKWEELMGWLLVPKLGEKLSWGIYDMPSRKCSHVYDMEVIGKAKVHGIEGVELTARESSYSDKIEVIDRTFVAQLTDTHCRYLAALTNDGDIRNYITFLDGDEFMLNWGFGEDNCGNETNLSPKGDIVRNGTVITSADKEFMLDIVGRYTVTIDGKSYDTVCVMDMETYNCGVVSEQFLDQNGKTILWRRFNRDDWAIDYYKKRWSEQLPENEQLMINGITYVHWYDCITDYIL
ncbi:MAG: RNA polymerase sigma factor [Lachnospiraceae bacterium]|nr:RNA polymerase sigma factor [Lachnospiraceae bacterium]MBD5481767.1 RNA polymerase sigma factor [Lachnospiraceae bacterium]